MSIQPPKIDSRSYEDIVAQTEALVEDFTISEVLPQDFKKLLLGRTLAEEVKDRNRLIAFSGQLIDKDLADEISKIQDLKRVKVKGWQPPGSSEIDPKEKSRLAGLILNQDVKDGDAEIIATRGTVIDTVLAEKLSKIEGLSRVKVKMQPPGSIEVEPNALVGRTLDQDVKDNNDTIATRGTVVDATLAERISQISSLKVVKVKVETDAGRGLIRIFGRMAALVSDRLNQAPDKNFLAFLDLIGTQLLPPQPAKVPLTFSLVEMSPVDALVPAHTQVAAPPADEQEEEVVFETDRELVVTTAQLKAVFVREPEKDKYSDRTSQATGKSDRTSQATGKKDAAFEAFTAEQPIEHCLYLACDELFTLPGNKTITLKFEFTEATDLANLPKTWSWSYWDGSWRSLSPFLDQKAGNSEVIINNPPVPTQLTINGIETVWLRASLEQTFLDENVKQGIKELKVKDVRDFIAANNTIRIAAGSNNQEDCKVTNIQGQTLTIEQPLKYSHPKDSSVCLSKLPTINRITVSANIEQNDLTPEFCFFNTVPLDLSKDFYPFGEQPHFNDTLYISSKQAFAQPGAVVTIVVTLSEGLSVKADGGVQVAWEVWDGGKWLELLKSSSSGSTPDATNFTSSGEVSLALPATIAPTQVNGESNYWIRVRIVNKGNYGSGTAFGQPITFTTLSEDANIGATELKVNSARGFMAGDSIRLGLGSNTQEERTIESVKDSGTLILTQQTTCKQVKATSVFLLSNLNFGPPSIKSLKLRYSYTKNDVSLSACQTYNDFIYVNRLPENSKNVSPFSPFILTADKNPALYLGFDKPFANRHTSLFAQVEPPQSVQPSDTEPVRLVWEYASPSGWSWLGVQDETNAFAERGLIQFIGPTDWEKTSEFGQELFWLRVNWQEGQFRVPPRLQRLLTNTMWATQAITLENEILGSSDGTTSQIFRTVQKPVLQGEKLEVQEVKIPSAEERTAIELLEGNDAVKVVRDEAGQIEAVWVRWHKVRDFYGSEPGDRHYVLDRLTGELLFGDGQYGMVPPQGRNNIRLCQYQTGGGTRGNLAANTVVQLKTTVPYIEKVTNLEAAGGGTEQESIDRVKERGPKFLRHRDRAVTIQDFEDLAYEALPDVARAKAIAPTFKQKSQEQKDNRFDPLDPNLWLDPNTRNPNLDNHNKAKADNAGQIRILIVPRTTAPQPVPSLGLIDRVKAYMRERCDPSVDLQVTGPEWQAVSVTAEVVPKSLEKADAVRAAVVEQLEKFLHPLTGGKKGQGWALGRLPQQSDLYAVIQSISGVDHVRSLKVEPDPETKHLSPEQLIYSGTLIISSNLPKEGA
ncbi:MULTISPECIES: putative baseplate assembly protein [unclassified Microcoleus]|uniref:putative baseplate assembly protein n=1 Tax=unclassified Microcoleus TaxID=2642155 RepID=UPI002FD098D6